MALHSGAAKIGMAVVLFFQFAGWVVTLGGLGHVTQQCRTEDDSWNGNTADKETNEGGHLQPFPGNFADEEQSYDCGIHFSLDWWIVAYQFFLIVFAYLAVFVEFFHTKYTVMSLYAIGTTLYTLFASIHTKLGYGFEGGSHSENSTAQGYKTNIAGAVIVLVCNYVFMFVFGSEETPGSSESSGEKGQP